MVSTPFPLADGRYCYIDHAAAILNTDNRFLLRLSRSWYVKTSTGCGSKNIPPKLSLAFPVSLVIDYNLQYVDDVARESSSQTLYDIVTEIPS
jgi:hypothetical protein